jgi:hypothetical protein
MANKKRSALAPEYIELRSDLLTELALARLPDLRAYRLTDREPFDKLAVTDDGFCFFVMNRGFSSADAALKNVDKIAELTCPFDSALLPRAHQSRSPVVLFYFDADTEHGRYLRLDTLPKKAGKELRLPVENTITKASLQELIREMQAAPKASRAS